MKTNLLLCVDDVLGRNDVIFIAATNRPHDLDSAFLRRMELHMELALPTTQDKLTLGRRHVPEMESGDVDVLFDTWTLHDINKFFRFVERRRWMHDLSDQTVDMEFLQEMYAVYVSKYVLKSY
jgi:SpoVK/Ycf46/Vps4 family AAA+-type ATPase